MIQAQFLLCIGWLAAIRVSAGGAHETQAAPKPPPEPSWTIDADVNFHNGTQRVAFRPGEKPRDTVLRACAAHGIHVASPECVSVSEDVPISLSFYIPHLSHSPWRDVQLRRTDILLALVETYGYRRYLEIGCSFDAAFGVIRKAVAHAVGVDPLRGGTHRMTSDEFFRSNTEVFDLIFVDGLHHAEQVLLDVRNALHVLSPNGAIVLHDASPRSYHAALRLESNGTHKGAWNGDVWKAVLVLRTYKGIELLTVDTDEGVAIIRVRPNRRLLPNEPPWNDINTLDYREHLEYQEADRLRLVTSNEVSPWLIECDRTRDTSMDAVQLSVYTRTIQNGSQPCVEVATIMNGGAGSALQPQLHVMKWRQCFALDNEEIGCLRPAPLEAGLLSVVALQGEGSQLEGRGHQLQQHALRTWLWNADMNVTCCTAFANLTAPAAQLRLTVPTYI